MTSKLKCPFCQTELEQMHDKKLLGCPKCLHIADGVFWVKAIQAKQDLKIATKALEEIKKVCDGCRWCGLNLYDPTAYDGRRIAETTYKALEQIEHKEDK